MKKQFEEISSQLDKIVGGQNLFNIDTQANDKIVCSNICTEKCTNGFGTITGEYEGTKIPEPLKPIVIIK